MRIRKKPIEVEGWKVADHNTVKFLRDVHGVGISEDPAHTQGQDYAVLDKFHGWVPFNLGDWIIRGTAGEHYPIIEKTFFETYEQVPVKMDYRQGVAVEL